MLGTKSHEGSRVVPFSMASHSAVSVTGSQSRPEIVKWKMPELNNTCFKFHAE